MKHPNHGGARPGSGPKPTPIDERRVISLSRGGMSQSKIAERFNVGRRVIRRVLRIAGYAR